MGFPILVRWHLYIESGPWHCHRQPLQSHNRQQCHMNHTTHHTQLYTAFRQKNFERGWQTIDLFVILCCWFPQQMIPLYAYLRGLAAGCHTAFRTKDLEGSVAVPIWLGTVSCNVGRVNLFTVKKNHESTTSRQIFRSKMAWRQAGTKPLQDNITILMSWDGINNKEESHSVVSGLPAICVG